MSLSNGYKCSMYLLICGRTTSTTSQSTTNAGANQAKWGEDVSLAYIGESRRLRSRDAIVVEWGDDGEWRRCL